MEDKREYSDEVVEAYKRVQDSFEKIKINKITILTGKNGSGKSLIRKQTPFIMKEYLDLDGINETKGLISSTSMEARTKSNPEWGALSSAMHDTEWIATSQNTFSSIQSLLNIIDKEDSTCKYLIIDEFEIGCGEETQLALVNYINDKLEKLIKETQLEGALIITHSRIGVEKLKHDVFLNIDGLTKDNWINRKIEPTNLKELDDNKLFFYIRDKNKN